MTSGNPGVPRVSVVIPNYNYARYLDERFRSILDQTYRDYEIIFLDDASTDDSVARVRARFGAHIHRFDVSAANSGNPFVQWNRGVSLCRGEFVWIAEADDSCTPDFLGRMVAALDQSARIGMAYCCAAPVDDAGRVIDPGFYHSYVADLDGSRWHADFVADGREEVRRHLARKNTVTNVSGVLFRREAYTGAGRAPEHMSMCGDWLAYCRILHDWDLAYVAAPMNFHRQHTAKHTLNSVLDLTYFREFLQVQQYLADAFDLGVAEREAAFRRFVGEWDRLTLSHYGRIDLAGTLALARMAWRGYPGRAPRIAARFFANAAKSLGQKWRKS